MSEPNYKVLYEIERKLNDDRLKEIVQLEKDLSNYKKKYQRVVAPEVVRSWIERLEQQCGSSFPYDKTKYNKLNKNEKCRKIREDKWFYMLTQRNDDALLQPILDLLDQSQIRKFCKDLSSVYSIISDKIHNSKFEDPEELPPEYNLLSQKHLNYAIDIVMCLYQPFPIE